MNLRLNIPIIFCSTFILPTSFTLLVTQYEQHVLAAYYEHTFDYAKGEPVNELSTITDFSRFCKEVRRSRVFKMFNIDEGNPISNESSSTQYRIPRKYTLRERNQKLYTVNFRVNMLTKEQILPAFGCYNLQGIMRWFVTASFLPSSAFLFTIDNVHKNLQLQEILGRKSISVLKAVIDMSAMYTSDIFGESQTEYEFIKSMNSTNFSTEEPLCDLHPIMRFRLCSLITQRIQPPPLTATYESYSHPDILVYNQSNNNSTEYCPSITIHGWGLTKQMLYCSIRNINNQFDYKFFLNKNNLNPRNVFYIPYSEYVDAHLSTEFSEYEVPLLQYQQQYEAALKYLKI